jgi:hypothetical protein
VEKQLQDKLYYVVAMIEQGRLLTHTAPDEAVKVFETAMKVNDYVWESPMKVPLI